MAHGPMFNVPKLSQVPSTVYGKVAASLVQFIIPFAIEGKLISGTVRLSPIAYKLSKAVEPTTMLGRAAANATKGAAATFVAFSPSDPNLSAYLQSMPEVQKIPVINEITSLLATDHRDSNALNRFRNVLEGMGLGAAVSPILEGLGKGLVKVGEGTGKALNVIPGMPTAAKHIANAADWINQKTADAFAYTGRIDDALIAKAKALTGPGQSAELDAIKGVLGDKTTLTTYQAARSFWNAGNFAAQSLKDGTFNFIKTAVGWETKRTGESIMDIVRRVQKIGPTAEQDYKDLLLFRRARQLESTEKGYPIPLPTTQLNLSRLQALPHHDELEAEVQSLVNLNGRHLDMLVNTGKIDAKTKLSYQFMPNGEESVYVPFFRDQELKQLSSGKHLPALGSDLVHKQRDFFKGKTDAELQKMLDDNPIGDVFENLSRAYTTQSIDAMRNRVLNTVFRNIELLGDEGKAFAEMRPKEISKITLSKEQLEKGMNANLDDFGQESFDFFTKKQRVDDNSITFYKDGVKQVWDVKQPLLLDSLRAMGPQHVSDVMRIWSKFFSPLKNFSTKLITMNPAFWLIKNPIRDTMTSAFVSHSGLIPFWSLIPGLFKTFVKTDVYKDLELQGGGFGHGSAFNDASEKALTGKLVKYGFNPKTDSLITSPHKLSTFLAKIEDAIKRTEMASRVQEYDKLLQQGYSKEKAAYLAREVSVDFANRGSSAGFRAYASTVPFLNASIQGWNMMLRSMGAKRLLGRALSEQESDLSKQVFSSMFNMAVIGGVFLPLIQQNADAFFNDPGMAKEYQAIPAFLKNSNFTFIIPEGDGKYSRVFIPKPFEFAILTNLTEAMISQNYSMSDKSLILEYLKYTFSQTLMRGGISSNAPSVVRPFYDIATNTKYTGGPVVPTTLQAGNLSQRQPYTSPTAVFIAEHLQKMPEWANMVKSPMKVEYLINSFLGGLGASIPYTTDIIARYATGLPEKALGHGNPVPTTGPLSLAQNFGAGFVNSIYQSGPLRLTKNEEDMYAAVAHAKSVAADFNSVKQGLNGFTEGQRTKMLNDKDSKFWMQSNTMFSHALTKIAGINNYIDFLSQNDPRNLAARDVQIRLRQQIVDEIMSVFHSQLKEKQ
jgi:hypothetical protein